MNAPPHPREGLTETPPRPRRAETNRALPREGSSWWIVLSPEGSRRSSLDCPATEVTGRGLAALAVPSTEVGGFPPSTEVADGVEEPAPSPDDAPIRRSGSPRHRARHDGSAGKPADSLPNNVVPSPKTATHRAGNVPAEPADGMY